MLIKKPRGSKEIPTGVRWIFICLFLFIFFMGREVELLGSLTHICQTSFKRISCMVRAQKMFISLVLSESGGFTKSSRTDADIISHLQQHCALQAKSMQLLSQSEEFRPRN